MRTRKAIAGCSAILVLLTGGVQADQAGQSSTGPAQSPSSARIAIKAGRLLDEEGAALMEAEGTWLVPTLYTFQHAAKLSRMIQRCAAPTKGL
jgi:hypothetical protein